MTIRLAYMHPGRSAKTGRRHFRGKDRHGHQFWLMEVKGSSGRQWVLSVDLSGSIAEPGDRLLKASAADLRDLVAGRTGPVLIEEEVGHSRS